MAMAAAIFARAQLSPLTGCDASSPATPPTSAIHLAYYYAGQLVEANEVTHLSNLLTQARIADARKGLGTPTDHTPELIEEFGRGLIAEALRVPGGWFENHERFRLAIPELRVPSLDELLAA